MNLRIDGLDRVEASFLSLQQLSDDEIWAMIEPAATLLKERMQDVITRLFRQRSGSLHGSIEVRRKLSRGGAVFGLVGPNDSAHPKASHGKRKPRAQGGKGGSYAGTNAEVGWILEYGTSRIPGRHWMETACSEAEEELLGMLEAAWNARLDAAGF